MMIKIVAVFLLVAACYGKWHMTRRKFQFYNLNRLDKLIT